MPVGLAPANPPTVVTTAKVISPVAALDRSIVTEKLEGVNHSPAFLDAVKGIGVVQSQRDSMIKIAVQRYGNYKSMVAIGKDKYQIIFDKAEVDAVTAQFYLDKSGRVAALSLTEKMPKLEPDPQAPVSTKSYPPRCCDKIISNRAAI
jgi:hypothetical protein